MVEQLSIIPMEPSPAAEPMTTIRVPKRVAGQVRAIARQLEQGFPEPAEQPAMEAMMITLSDGPAKGSYVVIEDAATWAEADRLADKFIAERLTDLTAKQQKQFLAVLAEAVFKDVEPYQFPKGSL
jgi:hypothetical protein